MIWNFNYTIPALLVLIFFLIFYFLKPVLLNQSNRVFFSLVIAEVFGFFIAHFSCYIDNNSFLHSKIFLICVNNSYYISFILRYCLVSLFFATLLNVRIKKDIPTIVAALFISCTVFLIFINPWTKFIYTLGTDGKYIKADYYLLIYFANFITLILDLYYLIRAGKKLEIKEKISFVFSVLALFACSFMDIFYSNYLITDMFFLFVILILFFAFENPDIFIDKKTGLFNTQAFLYVINEFLFRQKKFFIISFTIKNYSEKKQIYGTKQMNMALREIGKFFLTLSHNILHNKKCFYMQNGSFVVIENNKKDLSELCDIIKNRFEQPWDVNNSELHLPVFIIDADNDISFNSVEDMSISYEIAFSEAKKSNINHTTINQQSLEEMVRKTKITKALNKALLEDNLQVYMQPIVDSGTRKIVAAEALVRIFDDELGIIPPVEFITMAEKNGSIEQLGEQVLNKVCIFLRESDVKRYGVKWINVNLSPVQCQNKNLPKKIDNITSSNTIKHQFIHLEITEESMIDFQILKNQMNVLITNGYKFSLDDFGTGFSNVAKVKSFPFDNIKLDMSIIREHFNSPDNILPSIIKNFNDRGLSVTAEGVETKEMADSLEEMGCKFLQGYYFSKPIPAKDFEKLVMEKKSE